MVPVVNSVSAKTGVLVAVTALVSGATFGRAVAEDTTVMGLLSQFGGTVASLLIAVILLPIPSIKQRISTTARSLESRKLAIVLIFFSLSAFVTSTTAVVMTSIGCIAIGLSIALTLGLLNLVLQISKEGK